MFSPRNRWVLGLGFSVAAVGWMGLIFYLPTLPGATPDTEGSPLLESGPFSWLGDSGSYAAHAVLFGALAALVQAALWGWHLGFRLRWMIVAAAFSTLFGISDEYHQSFVIGRSATLADSLVDAIAATLSAALLWLCVTRIISRRKGYPVRQPPNL